MKDITKSIALLATGDEILHGDILNTNSQQTSQRLLNQQIIVKTHFSTGDNIAEIKQAIEFLLKHHEGLIITGGLGPTSDDLTRYALSEAINKPLIFDNPTWENICERIKKFGYPTPPESNRQQALFPEGATIILNPHGTASGCEIEVNNKWIFMLPGPPDECLPMLDTAVIPTLINADFQQKFYREKWILFGVSEGKIAEELDAIVKPYDCETGYRLCYPYIEFKILSKNKKDFDALIPPIENIINRYLVGNGKQIASEQLKILLEQLTTPLTIDDQATGGLLESFLKTPKTTKNLIFSNHNPSLIISGLEDYWRNETTNKTLIRAELHLENKNENAEISFPLRGDKAKLFAVEWVCCCLMKWLSH